MSDTHIEMPEAPEGTFFRVKKASGSETYVKVQLRVKTSFLGFKFSYTWSSTIVSPYLSEVRYAAIDLVKRYRNAEKRDTVKSQLLGDYPPKKLGDIK